MLDEQDSADSDGDGSGLMMDGLELDGYGLTMDGLELDVPLPIPSSMSRNVIHWQIGHWSIGILFWSWSH